MSAYGEKGDIYDNTTTAIVEKKFRFIDLNYDEKFTIENGGTVVIFQPNKYLYDDWETFKYYQRCEALDDYHIKIFGDVFHICQLAEKTEKLGISVSPEKEEDYDAVYYFGHNTKTFLYVWRKDEIQNVYSFSFIYYNKIEKSFVEIENGEYFFPNEFTSYEAREYIIDEVKGYSQKTIDFFAKHQFDLSTKPRYKIDSNKFWKAFYGKY